LGLIPIPNQDGGSIPTLAYKLLIISNVQEFPLFVFPLMKTAFGLSLLSD